MGRRSQPRKQVEVPVRIFGTDKHGQTVSEKARVVNASRSGAELADVRSELKLDETIGVTYGTNRAHFRVKWIGASGTSKAGHVGLLNVSPEKPLWDFPLPPDALDNYQLGSLEGRTTARFRCQNSIEVHVKTGESFWGTVADLSLGGCYVEMAIPLVVGTKLRVGIWLGQDKAWAEAQVAHRTPGMGIGLKFIEISDQDRDRIRRYLENLAPFAKKSERSPSLPQVGKSQTKF
jgi:PilZ domain